jgi:UDP-glucuronate 4-epimerase
MKILVTGGAGFIGAHLCERLLSDEHSLIIVDELNDFYPPSEKRANLEEVRRVGEFELFESPIEDEAGIHACFERTRPEAVIHLAARAGVRPSLEQPLLYESANVRGTLVLLEAARRAKVRRFIFASSSSVYGAANQVPFREDDDSLRPLSPYAATKIAGEKLCYTYSHLYGISIACLRFFTVYGPRQRPDLAIRKFMERIDEGLPVPVFGDGSMGRDYTFVGDIVSGIVAALNHDAAYDIFNLGNSSPVLLRDMVRAIEAALGKPAVIDWKPEQPGDVPITCADISKAKRILGYTPATPFAEGLAKQAEWVRARR